MGPSICLLGDPQPNAQEAAHQAIGSQGVGRLYICTRHCWPRSHLRACLGSWPPQPEATAQGPCSDQDTMCRPGARDNACNRAHGSPQQAGLVLALASSWGPESCMLENFPMSSGPRSGGEGRGLQESSPLLVPRRGRDLGVPSPERQRAAFSWVPGDPGHAGSLLVERCGPGWGGEDWGSGWAASGIIWHLEPQQSLGVPAASHPQGSVHGGGFRRARVRDHGPEALFLEWGHVSLVVLGAQRK